MEGSSRSEGIPPRATFESASFSGEYRFDDKTRPPYTKKHVRLKNFFFFIGFLCISCTSLPHQSEKKTGSPPEPKEGMTLILNHTVSRREGGWLSSEDAQALEERINNAVEEAFGRSGLPLQIISPQKFRHIVFPALGFETAPHSPEYLTLLLKHPAFREKINSLGVRYLVIVSGQGEEYQHSWGDIFCGGGYGGGGCGGLIIWKKDYSFRAFILDTKQSSGSGEVTSGVSDHAWLAVIGILPIGFPAFSESKACQALGDDLVKFFESLMGGDTQKTMVH